MKTTKITCDCCGIDITSSNASQEYQLSVEVVYPKIHDPLNPAHLEEWDDDADKRVWIADDGAYVMRNELCEPCKLKIIKAIEGVFFNYKGKGEVK